MFYSRRTSKKSSLPRFTLMFVIGFVLSVYLAWTGEPTKSLVMLAAAGLCGAYAGWQAWQIGSWGAVQERFRTRWEQITGTE